MATAKRINVEIEKETKKAFLVKNESGQKGWIQRRWLKVEDMTVSENTFNKAVQFIANKKEANEAKKEWKNDRHDLATVKETEKGIACEALVDITNIDKYATRTVWFPKSVCEIKSETTFAAPGWLIDKKIDETVEKFQQGSGAMVENFGGMSFVG